MYFSVQHVHVSVLSYFTWKNLFCFAGQLYLSMLLLVAGEPVDQLWKLLPETIAALSPLEMADSGGVKIEQIPSLLLLVN